MTIDYEKIDYQILCRMGDLRYLLFMISLEYIWIDGQNGLRSKTKLTNTKLLAKSFDGNMLDLGKELLKNTTDMLRAIPWWSYDGSSTDQADTAQSDILLKPVALYHDPFRSTAPYRYSYLVMCETYLDRHTPHPTNKRSSCMETMIRASKHNPWFGVEQEYFMIHDEKDVMPYISNVGSYYCGVGSGNAFYRDLVEEHMRMCICAGLNIGGINYEVAPTQAEYQIGPCSGETIGDQVWISRYILIRLAEQYNIRISFHPKPYKGIWNGSGAHINFSTTDIRIRGLPAIKEAIEKLSHKHHEHLEVYGVDNIQRLTGTHETSSYDTFSSGESDRCSSVRIPIMVTQAGEQNFYFEDRRPAANADFYQVSERMVKTICLDE